MRNIWAIGAVILTAFGATTLVWAEGGESSGGGNAVVCFDHVAIANQVRSNGGVVHDAELEHITFIEMVDLYQAKKPRGLPPRKPQIVPVNEDLNVSDGDAIRDFFQKISRRFKFVFGDVSKATENMSEALSDEMLRFHPNPVHQMRDADLEIELHSPSCTFTTMAYNEIISEDLFYIHFDQRLFELGNKHTQHSRQSKAVLVLHEMIYLWARYMNQDSTSKKARDFVGYLISQNTGVSIQRFLEVADALGFMTYIKRDYFFAKNGMGMTFQPIFASYPVFGMLEFLTSAYHGKNGAGGMNDAYYAYQNVIGSEQGFISEIDNLLFRNNLNSLHTGNLNAGSAAVVLEVALGIRRLGNHAPIRLSDSDKILAERLLARAREHLALRKELIVAAGDRYWNEHQPKLAQIPYLSDAHKKRLADVASKLIRSIADKSMELTLEQVGTRQIPGQEPQPVFGGRDRFENREDPGSAWSSLKNVGYSLAAPLGEVLKETMVPSVE